MGRLLLILICLWLTAPALAAPSLPAVTIVPNAEGGQTWSLSLQILLLMTSLTLLPAAMLASCMAAARSFSLAKKPVT